MLYCLYNQHKHPQCCMTCITSDSITLKTAAHHTPTPLQENKKGLFYAFHLKLCVYFQCFNIYSSRHVGWTFLFPYLGIYEASLSELLDSPPQSTILIHLFKCKLNEPSINTYTFIYIHICS